MFMEQIDVYDVTKCGCKTQNNIKMVKTKGFQ